MTAESFFLTLAVVFGGCLAVAILVIGVQGQHIKAAHARLVEYANTIRELKERLSKPRAPKRWTHD